MTESTLDVEQHYGRDGLIAAISEGLRRAGKDLSRLSPADLAPIDEFHVRGRSATQELADAVKPGPGDRVARIELRWRAVGAPLQGSPTSH